MRPRCLFACLVIAAQLCAADIVDRLRPGDPDSDARHAVVSEPGAVETGAGLLGEPRLRLRPSAGADWRGGQIAFRLKVDPAAPNYLTLRLSGDEFSSTRLFLVVGGEMVGYLHLGDVDLLEPGASEPQAPGRFVYRTTPLPEKFTRGRSEIACEIRSTGPIWAYGNTFDRFQKPMTEPSRGIYGVYSHTEPAFAPPADEKQGSAPPDRIRAEPGDEVLAQAKARVNREITARLNDNRPLNQMQMLFLAEAWHVKWTAAYRNPDILRRILASLDAFGLAWRVDPKLATEDPATLNPGWFGAGPVGAALHWLAEPLAARLDDPVAGAQDRVTRRRLFEELLLASREWNARSRRLYTNQTMIKDLYGIYLANRGLQSLGSPKAWPEPQARRYLYEAIGLQPWLGSDLPGGGSEKPVGDDYLQLTARGLTRELGYVGSYGEVVDWATRIYDATRPSFDADGDPRVRDQLVKIALARAAFRHPAVDAEGFRAMRMETFVGWRDNKYPGIVTYAQKPNRDGSALDAAYATRDPRLLAYARQMIDDNQFFASLRDVMAENSALRITHGLLRAPEAFEFISALPAAAAPARLPMSPGAPDYVFTDEEDGVVALKHGDEVLYVSLYWRARHAVNFLASVHHIAPAFERQAIVRQEVRFTPLRETYRRPGTVVFGFGNGGSHLKYPAGSLPPSAHAGEELPIATPPPGATFKPGSESVYAGKGDFYLLRYGDYLIAMNCSAQKSAAFAIPAEFVGAAELTRPAGRPVPAGERQVPPRSTVILHRLSTR